MNDEKKSKQRYEIVLREFLVSGEHAYFSRSLEEGPAESDVVRPESIQVLAKRGIVGDRFFDTAPLYQHDEQFDGQVTFVSGEVLDLAARSFPAATSAVLRRNIVIEGVNLQRLIGEDFSIESKTSTVRFFGTKTCSPCRWLDRAGEVGILAFLRGRGGLRSHVLSDGELRLGAANLVCHVANLDQKITEPAAAPSLP